MANSDEKISKFVQAITQYAQEQRDKIHREVEDFKSERLQNAEQEVLRDSYQLIQKERADLRHQICLLYTSPAPSSRPCGGFRSKPGSWWGSA